MGIVFVTWWTAVIFGKRPSTKNLSGLNGDVA